MASSLSRALALLLVLGLGLAAAQAAAAGSHPRKLQPHGGRHLLQAEAGRIRKVRRPRTLLLV
jgi:hypothetical protein